MAPIKNEPPLSQNSAKTIGVFLSSTDDKFENALLRGLANAVTEAGGNLVCYTSGSIRSYHGFESQRNLLYDLVNKESFDGLVISGTLGHNVSHGELLSFCKRYKPLPLITAAIELEGVPAVLNGGREGITDMVTHLIDVHGLREIAFLRGPAGHQEADERYQAYLDTLEAHNIPIKEELILQGDYTYDSGRQAVKNLADIPVQAVVSANDSMVLGALEVLPSIGKEVPNDIAITGFDDTEESRQSTPPLTTLNQSVYDMGYQAGKNLLDILNGKSGSELITIPLRLMIRNSCGCADPRLEWAGAVSTRSSDEGLESANTRAKIQKKMQAVLHVSSGELAVIWTENILQALIHEMESERSSGFLQVMEDILEKSLNAGDEGCQWQDMISIMRSEILPLLDDPQKTQVAETLWQQSRVLISTLVLKMEEKQRLRIERRNIILREMSEALMSSSSRDGALEVMALDLPRLGIEACYLSLFENEKHSIDWSRLVFAYAAGTRLDLPAEGIRFPSRDLAPDDFLQKNKASIWVAEALYAKEERIGFMLLNIAPENAEVCGAIRGLVSNALQAVILNENRIEAEKQLLIHQKNLEEEVKARTLALRKTNEQLQQEVIERQRTEVEREALINELESKNVELEQFTYTVSHDLKSPLITISGFLGYLEDDAKSGNMERLRGDIRRIQSAVEKMQRLLNELLELSRVGRMVNLSETIPFSALAQDALALVHGRINSGGITVKLDPNLPSVYGDRQRLIEVLQNLIDNAAKYIGDQPKPVIEIGQKGKENGKPIFFVKDNGIGIASEYHEKIFGLFNKLDAKSEGTGIGLALVKRIVEIHGGRIWVESDVGAGATFYFTLPKEGS